MKQYKQELRSNGNVGEFIMVYVEQEISDKELADQLLIDNANVEIQ